jgi:RNA polymerase sigma-70 factor, ECF subfamily
MDVPAPSQSLHPIVDHASRPPLDFPALYKDHFSYAWKTLRRLGVHERDLADITHDFFIVVLRALPQYDRTRPIKPWLFGIAFRVVSDYRRSPRVSRELLREAPEVPDVDLPADDRLAAAQARALLLRALEELDLDRRAVFVMHDLDGQAVPEIASALAIPLGTAYSRLRLARVDLAAAVKRLRARRTASQGEER